jgi:hypothetical protein
MISMSFRSVLASLIILAIESSGLAQQPDVKDRAIQLQGELAKKVRQELSFLKCVVPLSPDQEARLSKFDVTKIEDNRIQLRKVAPGVDFGAGQVRIVVAPATLDPLRLRQMERAFEKEVASVLTAEQNTTYTTEKKLRDDFYKETAIRGILIILDKRLCLSKHQREEIYKSLDQWGGITSFDMTPYESSDMYLPAIPDSVLVDHLDANQKAILNSTSRIDFGNRTQIEQQLQFDQQLPFDFKLER